MDADKRVALVTGGSHGIGKATALALASLGFDVTITFRNRADGAHDVVRQVEALGRRALAIHAELPDEDDCVRIVEETIAGFGDIHVLVNNVGGGRGGALSDLNLDDWRQTFAINVTSPLLIAQTTVRHMIAAGHGGSIVNVSSVHSTHAWPNRAAYGVAKAALNRLTMSMALEWAPLGVRVNAVAPGYTNVSENQDEQARYDLHDGSSAPWMVSRRVATPAEIAAVIAFLCSDGATFVTGQTIFADGGLLIPPVTTANYMKGDRPADGFVG